MKALAIVAMTNKIDKAFQWLVISIIVVVGLYVITTLVWNFAQENPLYAAIMFGGGGVLAVIVAKAKGLF